jgi:thiol-disulfide isomerase/thioredoxin
MPAPLNRAERRQRGRTVTGSPAKARIIAIVATVVVLAVVAVVALVNVKSVPNSASEAPIYAPLSVGDPAPAFRVTTIDGVSIDSTSVSGPIMLEVFATWCPHCQHEAAIINALQRHFRKRLSIVAVSGSEFAADRRSPASLDDVRRFSQYFGVTYPIAYDADLAVAKSYLQGGYPTVVFINGAKRIAAIESGEIPLERLVLDARKAGA